MYYISKLKKKKRVICKSVACLFGTFCFSFCMSVACLFACLFHFLTVLLTFRVEYMESVKCYILWTVFVI